MVTLLKTTKNNNPKNFKKFQKIPKFQKRQKNPKKIQKIQKKTPINPKKIQKSIKNKKNPKNVKNGQKSENLKKSQKITFFEKKCYPLSFPILGGRDSTRALQSTPFQNPGAVSRRPNTSAGGPNPLTSPSPQGQTPLLESYQRVREGQPRGETSSRGPQTVTTWTYKTYSNTLKSQIKGHDIEAASSRSP